MTAAESTTEGTYGDRIVAVEPGGNEFIAEEDRHDKPIHLLCFPMTRAGRTHPGNPAR